MMLVICPLLDAGVVQVEEDEGREEEADLSGLRWPAVISEKLS